MFNNLLQGFRQLIFPKHCLVCHHWLIDQRNRLCPACLDLLTLNPPPFCISCAHSLDEGWDNHCPSCRRHPKAFDKAWAVFRYAPPLDELIGHFKYNGKTSLRHFFLPYLIRHIDTYRVPITEFDLICPLPLHPARRRERGYNQSALISELLANHYKILHDPNALQRIKATISQTQLQQKQRWTNMVGAFKINPDSRIINKSVLLVDDLMTTGSSAHAAALALKAAGAEYVGVLVLASRPML